MRRFLVPLALLAACAAVPAHAQSRIVNVADGSTTLTLGGTSQQVFPARQDRNYLFCQNPTTATESLFIDFGRSASLTTSIELAPGGTVSFLAAATPTMTVTVNAATTAHRFVCKEGWSN